jgi:arsenate reductase (glutaredoxin)
MIQVYHNPRCTKSRECVAFFENHKHEIQIIKYLETPFTVDLLKEIIQKLSISPIELIRTKEKLWIENYKNTTFTDDQLIEIMVNYPVLIERPIAVNGNKAVIARPLDKIKMII